MAKKKVSPRKGAKLRLRIVEGGYYKSRGGEVFGPFTRTNDREYPWAAGAESFTATGKFLKWDKSANDLVEPTSERPKNYKTLAVRFLRSNNLEKKYTYRVAKTAALYLGQEIIVPTPLGSEIAVVVEIHETPQDTGPFDYKFAIGRIAEF